MVENLKNNGFVKFLCYKLRSNNGCSASIGSGGSSLSDFGYSSDYGRLVDSDRCDDNNVCFRSDYAVRYESLV